MTKTERKELAAAQAREALQLVRYLANRAAEEHRSYRGNERYPTAFGMYLAYRTAAWLAAHHFKRHGLFPNT